MLPSRVTSDTHQTLIYLTGGYTIESMTYWIKLTISPWIHIEITWILFCNMAEGMCILSFTYILALFILVPELYNKYSKLSKHWLNFGSRCMWFPWCFSQNVLHNNCGHPSLRIMTFHHILPQTTPLPQESTISTMPTLGAYPVSPPVTPPPLSSPYPEFLVLPRVTHLASSSTSSSNTSSWETMSEEGTLDDNRLEDKEPPFSPL